MTTVDQVKKLATDKELHWFVESVVAPELPRLEEALTISGNLLAHNTPSDPANRGPPVTLPVSSNKSEWLKGILVRDGAKITKMEVSIREKNFNKHVTKLTLVEPIMLPQIVSACDSIDKAVEYLRQSGAVFGDDTQQDKQKHEKLMLVFRQVLGELSTAKTALVLPTDPGLVFPGHVTRPDGFNGLLDDHVAIDAYVSQTEVCIDMKSLHRVTELPWGDVDESSGKSFVDMVKDELSAGKSISDVIKDEQEGGTGLFGSVFGALRRHTDPQDYITRCVTYNGMVVMVALKIDVLCADPMLMSAFTKLDSVEYLVTRFVEAIGGLHCGA